MLPLLVQLVRVDLLRLQDVRAEGVQDTIEYPPQFVRILAALQTYQIQQITKSLYPIYSSISNVRV